MPKVHFLLGGATYVKYLSTEELILMMQDKFQNWKSLVLFSLTIGP